MGFLNQSPSQELFPVLIRNIKDVLYSQLFTVKPESPSQLNFESVGTNQEIFPNQRIKKCKMIQIEGRRFELARRCSNTTNELVIIFNNLELKAKCAMEANLIHSKEKVDGKSNGSKYH